MKYLSRFYLLFLLLLPAYEWPNILLHSLNVVFDIDKDLRHMHKIYATYERTSTGPMSRLKNIVQSLSYLISLISMFDRHLHHSVQYFCSGWSHIRYWRVDRVTQYLGENGYINVNWYIVLYIYCHLVYNCMHCWLWCHYIFVYIFRKVSR